MNNSEFQPDSQPQTSAADRRLDEVLAVLSHELRNPVAAIAFSLESLKDGEQLSPTGQQLVEIISRQTTQISKLLQDLLDVSRVTQNRITFEPELHDLNTSVADIIQAVEPAIVSRRQRLSVELSELPAKVYGDVVRLKQAMTNLLENASKYTPEEGQIRVTTRVLSQQVEFEVSDNGFGIVAAALPDLFQLFFQSNHIVPKESRGLGLGLYLVERILHAHSGTVVATSAGVDQGSQFTMTLPAAQ